MRNILFPACFLLAISGCTEKSSDTGNKNNTDIVVFGSDQKEDSILAPCIIRPLAIVKVKSEVSGRVDAIHAAPGDTVKEGTPLANIDTRAMKVSLERNLLAQRRITTQIKLQSIQIERSKRAKQVIDEINSKAELKIGETTARSSMSYYGKEAMDIHEAETTLQQLQLSLQDLRLEEKEIIRNISLAEIRSPLLGRILSRSIETGAVVGSGVSQFGGGDVLFEVADISKLKAECYARESEAWRLGVGQETIISTDVAKQEPIKSSISRIAPSIELLSGVPRLRFESDFSPSEDSWRVGVNAKIAVKTIGTSSSNTLPPDAVREESDGTYALVRRGMRFEKVTINAERTDDGWLVHSGLNIGDMVARGQIAQEN